MTPNAKSPNGRHPLRLSGQQQASSIYSWRLNLILPPENCNHAHCLTWCSDVSILSLLTDIPDIHFCGLNLSFLGAVLHCSPPSPNKYPREWLHFDPNIGLD